jgi:hypothetical protein
MLVAAVPACGSAGLLAEVQDVAAGITFLKSLPVVRVTQTSPPRPSACGPGRAHVHPPGIRTIVIMPHRLRQQTV